MKKYIVPTIIISILILSGCEDYLDRNPLDKISTPTFWKSKADFEMALTANYGILQTAEWSEFLPNWDNFTDNSYGQFNYGGTYSIVAGAIDPSTGGYISSIYKQAYIAIGRQNLFLEQLAAYEGPDFSDADKKIAEAEVRFFRAFMYFHLYDYYGDVPLVTEPLTIETQYQPKVPAAQVLTQATTDIDFAIANLEDVPFFENKGHVTKSSAQAFKARMLIKVAYGNDGTPDNAILTQVKDLCLEVMPQYSLSPVFEDIFRAGGQANNEEIIWSVNYLAPDNLNRMDMLWGDWVACSPLQSFVDDFECSDGLSWSTSPLADTANPFDNRDPRLTKTIFKDQVDFGNGVVHIPSNPRPTGYGVLKFCDPGNIPYDRSTLSQQNIVELRLADISLMYAEAQNEISGPDASVYAAVDSVRARVNMPPLPAGLSQAEMREKIRHERRIELAFEGLRYFDLRRWHIAGEVLPNVTDGHLVYSWEEKFYHWPLPQTEIDKSNGMLVQNPDWD